MNKAVRLALLLSLIALTSWISMPKAAYALPVCNNINGRACLTPNKTWQCTWIGGGGEGVCICDSETLTWDCF